MKWLWRIVLLAVIAAWSLTFFPANGAISSCGTERWNVKTLSDPDVANLKTIPVEATVEQLRALPVPGPIQLHTPRFPAERQEYAVTAALKFAKVETDRDLHVVIAGTSGATMIAEFVNPACVANSVYRQQIGDARQAFVKQFGTPRATGFKTLSGSALLKGILFFDVLHGQRGVAPNGVEIHPVLSMEMKP
jgi:hypothetical protein